MSAPQHRTDPSEQFPESERLDQVVVRAELEAHHTVDLLSLCGDHDDRNVGPGTEHPAYLRSVDVRKPQVEQHEIGWFRSQRARASRDPFDAESFAAETRCERLRDRVLVLDEQDVHAQSVASSVAGSIGGKPNPYLGLDLIYLPRARG